jgi:capsular polysaccharide biosynthesis protein
VEPKDFARILLRRRRTVVTAILIVVATAFLGSMRKTPTYVAECEVLYGAVLSDPSNPESEPLENIGDLNSNVHFISSPIIAAGASKLLGGAVPAAEIQSKVNAELAQDTQFFRIRVVDRQSAGVDPAKRSGQICNAVGQAYVKYKREYARKFFQDALLENVAALKAARRDLNAAQRLATEARARGDEGAEIEAILTRDQHGQIIQDLSKRGSAFRRQIANNIDGGSKVTSPSGGGLRQGGDHKRDVMLGLIVGLMFGIGIALVREYLDDTVRDKESTQRDLGLPVLANLPSVEGMEGFLEPDSSAVEAARQLRAALASLGFPHERSTLVIAMAMSNPASVR